MLRKEVSGCLQCIFRWFSRKIKMCSASIRVCALCVSVCVCRERETDKSSLNVVIGYRNVHCAILSASLCFEVFHNKKIDDKINETVTQLRKRYLT